jgi:hypothetical protein
MTAPRPCYRHPRRIWMLACPDCTAWHLPAARARRDSLVSAAADARVIGGDTRRPDGTHVPPTPLRLVA